MIFMVTLLLATASCDQALVMRKKNYS